MPVMASLAVPAGIFPGHHAIVGTRMPPSSVLPLWPRSGVHGARSAAVVAGENDQCAFGQTVVAHGVEHPPNAPVHFLDPVRVDAVRRFARPFLAGINREMHRVVRQIEKERRVLVLRDELHRLVGVDFHERLLVVGQHAFDDRAIAQQRKRRLAFALGSGSGLPRSLFTPSAAGPMSFE